MPVREAARAEAENGKMRATLEAYERWEADLIEYNAAWKNGTLTISQAMWDRFIEIQAMRNEALGR
jgi:hypothetical protein